MLYFCISYREKVEYLLNFSLLVIGNTGKILLVFKRFCVESFVWIRRAEIFVSNFSKYLVLLACACIMQHWPMKSPFSCNDVKLTPIGALWPLKSIAGISRVIRCKHRIVLTFWNLFLVQIKHTIGPEMEMLCTFVKFEDTDSQMTPEIRLLTLILTRLLQRRHVWSYVRRKVWLVYIFVQTIV